MGSRSSGRMTERTCPRNSLTSVRESRGAGRAPRTSFAWRCTASGPMETTRSSDASSVCRFQTCRFRNRSSTSPLPGPPPLRTRCGARCTLGNGEYPTSRTRSCADASSPGPSQGRRETDAVQEGERVPRGAIPPRGVAPGGTDQAQPSKPLRPLPRAPLDGRDVVRGPRRSGGRVADARDGIPPHGPERGVRAGPGSMPLAQLVRVRPGGDGVEKSSLVRHRG